MAGERKACTPGAKPLGDPTHSPKLANLTKLAKSEGESFTNPPHLLKLVKLSKLRASEFEGGDPVSVDS